MPEQYTNIDIANELRSAKISHGLGGQLNFEITKIADETRRGFNARMQAFADALHELAEQCGEDPSAIRVNGGHGVILEAEKNVPAIVDALGQSKSDLYELLQKEPVRADFAQRVGAGAKAVAQR